MTIRIGFGGEEKILEYPRLMSLKFDMLGGVNIIGNCEGEVVEEFDLGGIHFAVHDDEVLWRELACLIDEYDGHLLFEATINGVEIRYTR